MNSSNGRNKTVARPANGKVAAAIDGRQPIGYNGHGPQSPDAPITPRVEAFLRIVASVIVNVERRERQGDRPNEQAEETTGDSDQGRRR